jgi:hypothetical protein
LRTGLFHIGHINTGQLVGQELLRFDAVSRGIVICGGAIGMTAPIDVNFGKAASHRRDRPRFTRDSLLSPGMSDRL